jgi:hypothetical protein
VHVAETVTESPATSLAVAVSVYILPFSVPHPIGLKLNHVPANCRSASQQCQGAEAASLCQFFSPLGELLRSNLR